ncbi:Ubiquinone biosynthesis protein COQ9 mitochondrial [Fasciola hepatica]|uniref:Ubiquinone biosynthesis protein n=1 Tax=Fasciola hepatica TaxID=6192 RepID=A0A4E0RPQ1_FASHE|nr:Ubiquinone biosynthesis protein COQ9 mitochondrial [Fasciola hepatica]
MGSPLTNTPTATVERQQGAEVTITKDNNELVIDLFLMGGAGRQTFWYTSRNTRVLFLPTPEQLSSRPSSIGALPSLLAAQHFSFSTENVHQSQSNTFSANTNQNATLQWDTTDLDLRHRVLESAVSFVPIHGWSRQAVEAACQAERLPSGLHTLAMPQGPIDLVLHFYASRNQRLAEAMSEWRLTASSSSSRERPSVQGVDEFLYQALKFRLEQIIPVLNEWPQALGLLALPSNLPSSVGLLAQLVDEIWAQAGDRSTDLKAVTSMVRDGVMAFGNVTCNILRLPRRR